MSEALREMVRRLHEQVERHPHLSGLQTNEHQGYLRRLWSEISEEPYPGDEAPNYAFDISEFDDHA
jgi:hypothetical protein